MSLYEDYNYIGPSHEHLHEVKCRPGQWKLYVGCKNILIICRLLGYFNYIDFMHGLRIFLYYDHILTTNM